MTSVDTQTSNVLVALASIEVKQASLSAQLLEASAREDERFKVFQRLADERHEALVERLDERQKGRERFEESILDCVKEIRESLSPLEERLEKLEAARRQITTAGATTAGVTVTLAGVIAWVIEHTNWFAPIFVAVVASSCA